MAFIIFINVFVNIVLSKFESFILIFHIIKYFAIFLSLLIFKEHQDLYQIFNF